MIQGDNSPSHRAKAPSSRGWKAPALVNLGLTLCLGVGVILVFCTLVGITPLPFLMKWYHALILLLVLTGGVVVAVIWMFRQRRWWFLGIPPIIGFLLILLGVVLSFVPRDDYQRFILQCATIKRGETIEEFEARMEAWGCTIEVATYVSQALPSGISEKVCVSEHAGAEAFYVRYDAESREIQSWEFHHD